MKKQTLKTQISQGRTKDAIKELLEITKLDAHWYNQIGTNSARFNQWENKKNTGIADNNDLNIEINQINHSLLNIIDQLPLKMFESPIKTLHNILSNRLIVLILILEIIIGFLGELMPDDLKKNIENLCNGHYTEIWVSVVLLTIFLLIWFVVKKEALEKTQFINKYDADRLKILNYLLEDYKERFKNKLNERIKLDLELTYTQQGTNKAFVDRHFADKAKTSEDIRDSLYNVFKKHTYILIVGEAGGGKTTLLLDLALELLEKATNNSELAIPVIFNLASWTGEQEKFENWLIDILVQGNGFSRYLAQQMIFKNRIIPLFDGLDEVGSNLKSSSEQNKLRSLCLQSMAFYKTNNNIPNMVICSKKKEYSLIKAEYMPFEAQILVKPLTIEKINETLKNIKDGATDFTVANRESAKNLLGEIKINKGVREVMCTPFYFNIAVQVLDVATNKKILITEKQALEGFFVGQFINDKLKRTENLLAFPKEKVYLYLNYIAKTLQNNSLKEFELTTIQPSFLNKPENFGKVYSYLISILPSIGIIYVGGFKAGFFSFCLFTLSAFAYVSNKKNTIQREDFRVFQPNKIVDSIFKMIFILILSYFFFWIFSFFFDKKTILASITGYAFGILFFDRVNELFPVSNFIAIASPYQRFKQSFWFNTLRMIVVFSCIGLTFNELTPKLFLISICLGIYTGIVTTPLFFHLLLRLCLRIENKIPLRYVHFLNYAVKLQILEKTGGQWRFRHQILQNYFSKLDTIT